MVKLLMNIPRVDGDAIEKHAYIVFGKCYKKTRRTERVNDIALGHDPVPDGWYLVFTSPFRKNKKYLSPNSCTVKEGICEFKYMLRVRKIGWNKHYSLTHKSMWYPINEFTDIAYNDLYVEAIKIKNKVRK